MAHPPVHHPTPTPLTAKSVPSSVSPPSRPGLLTDSLFLPGSPGPGNADITDYNFKNKSNETEHKHPAGTPLDGWRLGAKFS